MRKILLGLTSTILATSLIGGSVANLQMTGGPKYTSSCSAAANSNYNYVSKEDSKTKGYQTVAYQTDSKNNTWVVANSVNGQETSAKAYLFYNANFGDNASLGISIFANSETMADSKNVAITMINDSEVVVTTIVVDKAYIQAFYLSPTSPNIIEHTNATVFSIDNSEIINNDAHNLVVSDLGNSNNFAIAYKDKEVAQTQINMVMANFNPAEINQDINFANIEGTLNNSNASKVTKFVKSKVIDTNNFQTIISTDRGINIVSVNKTGTNWTFTVKQQFADDSILSNLQFLNNGSILFVNKHFVDSEATMSLSTMSLTDQTWAINANKAITIDAAVLPYNTLDNSVLDSLGDIYFTGNFTSEATNSNQVLEFLNDQHINFDANSIAVVSNGFPGDQTNPVHEVMGIQWNVNTFNILVNYGNTEHYKDQWLNGLYSVSTPDSQFAKNINYGAIVGAVFGFLVAVIAVPMIITFAVKYYKNNKLS